MNIAILADDKKKELMVQFCIAYCGILAKHRLCATATTGKLVFAICTTFRSRQTSRRERCLYVP